MDHETFDLGNVALQSGATLQNMKLGYKTYGDLNAARDRPRPTGSLKRTSTSTLRSTAAPASGVGSTGIAISTGFGK